MIEHHVDSDYRDEEWPLSLLTGLCSNWTERLLSGKEESTEELESIKILGIDNEKLSAANEAWVKRHGEIVELSSLFVIR